MRNNVNNVHQNFKNAQTTVEFLLGPVKIKDGLFMGDQLAAKDIEFIMSNKVTHIINTVSKSLPNLYERFGVQYLSVHWAEKQQNIFDKKNNAVNAIFTFIEEAMEQGQSCLIHSLHGKSRSCAVLVAYLMKKYNWSLKKSLELVNSKKQGLEIRQNFLTQMQDLEKRMAENMKLTNNWDQIKNEQDELLSNTFYNSKKAQPSEVISQKKVNRKRITWDEKLVQKSVPTTNLSVTMTRFKQQLQKKDTRNLKSILKGFPNQQLYDFYSKNQFKNEGQQKLVNNINANIVHVTVNNFITTEKKPVDNFAKTSYNNRPYSSDNKERQKKNVYDVKPSKLFAFDTPNSTNIKTAYENKIIGKVATTTYGNKSIKKKQEIKNPMITYDNRPLSANTPLDRKKVKNPIPFSGIGGQEMTINGKKRYPSSNPKEDGYRLK